MEVDTPPRPAEQAAPIEKERPPLEPESLGLHACVDAGDDEATDKSLVMVDAFIDQPPLPHASHDEDALRRRRRKSPSSAPVPSRVVNEGEYDRSLFAQGKEFSFQVHHHHGIASNGFGADYTPASTSRVLLGYVQLASISLLSILVLSLLLLFLYTLYTDITTRLAAMTIELRAEILACAKAYVDNRCEPLTRIPAMEERCAAWEDCMRREVIVHGKTKVVAETLAEIVNGFVEVISFRTMIFLVAFLCSTVYVSSFALSLLPKGKPHYVPPHHVPLATAGHPVAPALSPGSAK